MMQDHPPPCRRAPDARWPPVCCCAFSDLRAIDPGFSHRSVLAGHVIVPYARYRTFAQQAAFFAKVLERVRSLPACVRRRLLMLCLSRAPVEGPGFMLRESLNRLPASK